MAEVGRKFVQVLFNYFVFVLLYKFANHCRRTCFDIRLFFRAVRVATYFTVFLRMPSYGTKNQGKKPTVFNISIPIDLPRIFSVKSTLDYF